MVMDYADGGDLSQKIKRRNGEFFSESQILDWFTQVCLAIKHIHDRKIIHRDIKSGNIFLTKNNLVKLGDFGISKCLNTTLDKAKTIIGTPYYLSPEIINSQPYDFKSDIWSLGVLLYEMCMLKMPFEGNNIAQLSLKIMKGSYQPLSSVFSSQLKKLVDSMLNVNTIKRPNINDILRKSFIQNRIKNFLNEKQFNLEFSHTIIHNFSLGNSNSNSNVITNNSEKLLTESSSKNNSKNHIKPQIINNGSNKKSYEDVKHLIKSNSNNNNINKSNNNYHYKDYNNNNLLMNLKNDLKGKPFDYITNDNNKNYINNYNNYYINNINNYNVNRIKSSEYNNFFINQGSSNKSRDYKEKYNNNLIKKENSERLIRNFKVNNNDLNNINEFNLNNNFINNSNNYRSNSNKYLEKNKLEEFKRLKKQQLKYEPKEDVIWMKGMEPYIEKLKEEKFNSNNNNLFLENLEKEKEMEIKNKERQKNNIFDDIIINNNVITNNNNNESDLTDINTNITNNKNLSEYEKIKNEEPLNDSINKLYENILDNNNNEILNLNIENEYFNEEDSVENQIKNELEKELGIEIVNDLAKYIKKNINDEMIDYDYDNLTDNLREIYKKKNLSKNIIDKAINKIPDIYFLILKKRI